MPRRAHRPLRLPRLPVDVRWKLAAVVVAPVLALNLAVGFFGNSLVFPLSPFYLRPKLHALGRYFLHRPKCLLFGHPDPAPLIAAAERRHHLPPGLLRSLLDVESGLQPHRISCTGAMGMAQLVPSTSRALAVADPYDTPEAIDAGARYLAQQLARFRSIPLAVAAYNAGPGNVGSHVPTNGETEVYVARVTQEYARLRPKRRVRP